MVKSNRVPFVDLERLHQPMAAELERVTVRVLREKHFIQGSDVAAFEREMSAALNGAPVCGVSCATFGLLVALKALGIGPGDEVITTPHTAIATAEAISLAGAKVVFADLEPRGFCLDPADVRRKITPQTRALLPVHLYGQPVELDALTELAQEHNLRLIEDCAQAQGARHRGRRVGTIGDAGVFSFFPSKNLGGFGDGGAVTSRHPEVLRRMRMLANHGRESKFDHELIGMNSRLDTLQAALLRVCLPHLDEWNAKRRAAARLYDQLLAGIPEVETPWIRPETEPVYHLYVIRVPDREALAGHLRQQGIETGLHYPMALHQTKAYGNVGYRLGDLPTAETVCRSILSLPMHPGITPAEVETVSGAIREYYQTAAGASAVRAESAWKPTVPA